MFVGYISDNVQNLLSYFSETCKYNFKFVFKQREH
jgi:hypothetical protein